MLISKLLFYSFSCSLHTLENALLKVVPIYVYETFTNTTKLVIIGHI